MRHSGVKSPPSVENAEIQIKSRVLYLGSPPDRGVSALGSQKDPMCWRVGEGQEKSPQTWPESTQLIMNGLRSCWGVWTLFWWQRGVMERTQAEAWHCQVGVLERWLASVPRVEKRDGRRKVGIWVGGGGCCAEVHTIAPSISALLWACTARKVIDLTGWHCWVEKDS